MEYVYDFLVFLKDNNDTMMLGNMDHR